MPTGLDEQDGVGSDGRISYSDVGLARARERRVDGLRLRGYLR